MSSLNNEGQREKRKESVKEKKRADRTYLKRKDRSVRTSEINRLENWREGHTARKRANATCSLCSLRVGVYTADTHTSGCHNSSSSHKKERERERRLAVISTIQTTQFSLSGHIEAQYGEKRFFSTFHHFPNTQTGLI